MKIAEELSKNKSIGMNRHYLETALENVSPSEALRNPISSTEEIQLLIKYFNINKL